MKHFSILLILLVSCLSYTIAQTPQQFKYQAVLRDASGNIIVSQAKTVIIEILQGAPEGSVVFSETHQVTTSSQGIINLNIGSLQPLNIDWATNTYYIKVTVGGIVMGTSQLLSVPYALNAKYAESADYQNLLNKPVLVTNSLDGLMSALDKTKLDGVEDGAQTNVNADWNASAGDALILNKPGNATVSANGLMSASDKSKLDGIEPGSKANVNADWNATSGDALILNKPVNASTSSNGFMSASDKSKLDGIETGAKANVNADWNATSGDALILNKPVNATVTTDGLMSSIDKARLDAINGSETKLTAGSEISITGSGTTGSPYVISSSPTQQRYIGELYGGGIIFWLSPDKTHGLIMSPEDLATEIPWSNLGVATLAYDMYDGKTNTETIIAVTGDENNAAKICYDYTGGGYDDWYLPASWEISLIYHQAYTLNFVLGNDGDPVTVPIVTNQLASPPNYPYYWSSTEYSTFNSFMIGLRTGYTVDYVKTSAFRVRAVRSF
jgi:hypothetical protein